MSSTRMAPSSTTKANARLDGEGTGFDATSGGGAGTACRSIERWLRGTLMCEKSRICWARSPSRISKSLAVRFETSLSCSSVTTTSTATYSTPARKTDRACDGVSGAACVGAGCCVAFGWAAAARAPRPTSTNARATGRLRMTQFRQRFRTRYAHSDSECRSVEDLSSGN